jgi:hypothetical protein
MTFDEAVTRVCPMIKLTGSETEAEIADRQRANTETAERTAAELAGTTSEVINAPITDGIIGSIMQSAMDGKLSFHDAMRSLLVIGVQIGTLMARGDGAASHDVALRRRMAYDMAAATLRGIASGKAGRDAAGIAGLALGDIEELLSGNILGATTEVLIARSGRVQ